MDWTVSITIFVSILLIFVAYLIGHRLGSLKKHREWEAALPMHRKDAIMKSRAVIGGQFSEQIAPFLPNFRYLPTECKFIGKPIDFLVFKGMDEKKIEEVIFVEVKSGNAKLSAQEKNLREAIDKKRVKWEEYRIPEELTKKRDFEE